MGSSSEQIRSYLQKFFVLVSNDTKEESQKKADTFIQQTERNASDLRRNPLLLGLMAWLFSARGNVPENLPQIYSECALLMFEKWDERRGIKAAIPLDFDLLHLFSHLASKIYGDVQREEGVSDNWLIDEVATFFRAQYEERARALATAKDVQSFLVGRAWVMNEVGDRIYKFTHRTFLEYFFARHLAQLHDDIRKLLVALRPRIQREEWEVVNHLALQIFTYKNPRRTAEAVARLEELAHAGRSQKQKRNIVRFISRALSYLPAPEANIRQLIETLIDRSAELAVLAPNDMSLLGNVTTNCIDGCRERRAVVYDALAVKLAEIAVGEPKKLSRFALTVISEPETILWQAPPDTQKRADLQELFRKRALAELKPFILENANSNPTFGLLAWEWYNLNLSSLARRHGISFLLRDFRAPIESMALFKIMVYLEAASSKRRFHRPPNEISQESAIEALHLIAELGPLGIRESGLLSGLPRMVFDVPRKWLKEMVGEFAGDDKLLLMVAIWILASHEAREVGAQSRRAKHDNKQEQRQALLHSRVAKDMAKAENQLLKRGKIKATPIQDLFDSWATMNFSFHS